MLSGIAKICLDATSERVDLVPTILEDEDKGDDYEGRLHHSFLRPARFTSVSSSKPSIFPFPFSFLCFFFIRSLHFLQCDFQCMNEDLARSVRDTTGVSFSDPVTETTLLVDWEKHRIFQRSQSHTTLAARWSEIYLQWIAFGEMRYIWPASRRASKDVSWRSCAFAILQVVWKRKERGQRRRA